MCDKRTPKDICGEATNGHSCWQTGSYPQIKWLDNYYAYHVEQPIHINLRLDKRWQTTRSHKVCFLGNKISQLTSVRNKQQNRTLFGEKRSIISLHCQFLQCNKQRHQLKSLVDKIQGFVCSCQPGQDWPHFIPLTGRNPSGGQSKLFYTGRLRTKVQPLAHLHTTFDKKRYPFLIPTNSKSSLDYMQHLVNWNNNAARSVVSKYFNPRPFKYLSDRFPYPFIYFN